MSILLKTHMNKHPNDIEFLLRAQELSGVGYWHVDLLDNNKLYWSENVFKIHGIEPSDQMPTVEQAIAHYHPDDRLTVQENVQAAALNGSDFEFDLRIVQHSGDIRYVSSVGECLKDEQGNVIALFGVLKDITQFKEKELEQARESHFNEIILNSIPDVVFVKDEESRIERGNDAFMSFYPPEKRDRVIGYTTVEEYPEHQAADFLEQDRIALKQGKSEIIEKVDFPDGRSRTLFTKKVGFTDPSGDRHLLGVSRDITDMKRIEEELIQSNLELERFAFLASHDLQEPLRMVSEFTKLLQEEHGASLPDGDAQKYMEFIVNGAERMQNLIRDILDYSRAGDKYEKFERFDANDQVRDALTNLDFVINETKADVDVGELPSIYAHPFGFMRVIQNLIGNALKYQNPDQSPEINVTCKEEQDEWVFSVQDNGIGIKPEDCENIFTLFKRLHHKSEYSGTGVGLAICKKIVESFSGKLWVESDMGQGTTFYFTVPKHNDDTK